MTGAGGEVTGGGGVVTGGAAVGGAMPGAGGGVTTTGAASVGSGGAAMATVGAGATGASVGASATGLVPFNASAGATCGSVTGAEVVDGAVRVGAVVVAPTAGERTFVVGVDDGGTTGAGTRDGDTTGAAAPDPGAGAGLAPTSAGAVAVALAVVGLVVSGCAPTTATGVAGAEASAGGGATASATDGITSDGGEPTTAGGTEPPGPAPGDGDPARGNEAPATAGADTVLALEPTVVLAATRSPRAMAVINDSVNAADDAPTKMRLAAAACPRRAGVARPGDERSLRTAAATCAVSGRLGVSRSGSVGRSVRWGDRGSSRWPTSCCFDCRWRIAASRSARASASFSIGVILGSGK